MSLTSFQLSHIASWFLVISDLHYCFVLMTQVISVISCAGNPVLSGALCGGEGPGEKCQEGVWSAERVERGGGKSRGHTGRSQITLVVAHRHITSNYRDDIFVDHLLGYSELFGGGLEKSCDLWESPPSTSLQLSMPTWSTCLGACVVKK